MPCRECQDKIRSATAGIYHALKPCHKSHWFDDQDFAVVLAYLRKIEKQVASKHERKPTTEG